MEFAYTLSLFLDIICSHFPTHHQELNDYLSLVLNLALCFSGNSFYQYHIHFTSEAAAHLQQFNEATYWGTMDSEIYCHIFANRPALSCSLCGALSHRAASCFVPTSAKPHPPQTRATAFSRVSSPAPLDPPIPEPTQSYPLVTFSMTSSINKKGRSILHQRVQAICNNFNDASCNMSQCRFLSAPTAAVVIPARHTHTAPLHGR